jgi:hypothetical protein
LDLGNDGVDRLALTAFINLGKNCTCENIDVQGWRILNKEIILRTGRGGGLAPHGLCGRRRRGAPAILRQTGADV